MKVYNIEPEEYIKGEEFLEIIDCIANIRALRAMALQGRYPHHKVTPRVPATREHDRNAHGHLFKHKTPFFDVICESLLRKDNDGFLDIPEFTYQMNCFAKTIFHRKKWNDMVGATVQDNFLNFIWDDYKENQHNGEFDKLEKTANMLFEMSPNLAEYHRVFIYNQNIEFVTSTEMKELFIALAEAGIVQKVDRNLVQIYEDVSIADSDTDIKEKFHSGKLTQLDKLYTEAKFNKWLPLMTTLESKFNFVPIHKSTNMFNGTMIVQKLGARAWLVPQFLIFYGNKSLTSE